LRSYHAGEPISPATQQLLNTYGKGIIKVASGQIFFKGLTSVDSTTNYQKPDAVFFTGQEWAPTTPGIKKYDEKMYNANIDDHKDIKKVAC